MLKIIPGDSYDFQEASTQMIKFSRKGLIGDDYSSLVKRAGAELACAMKKVALHPGEVAVHQLALGATERWGANRNADGFPESSCERDHDTFRKHAMVYRHHFNTDPRKSYGRVVYSAFNRPMSRIELIATYNSTKEAAAINRGLVADIEMNMLEKGDPIPISMSTRIPRDICSGCGNHARTRKEYCGREKCVKYGGLKNNLGRTFEDGHHLHAINDINDWFDISRVNKGADRTAFCLGRVSKAASALVIGGAELAEQLELTCPVLPELLDSPLVDRQAKVAAALAASCRTKHPLSLVMAFGPDAGVIEQAIVPRNEKLAAALANLGRSGTVLSLEGFFLLSTPDRAMAKEAARMTAPYLAGTYESLATADQYSLVSNQWINPVATLLPGTESRKAAAVFGLKQAAVQRRATLAALRSDQDPYRFIGLTDPAGGPSHNCAEAAKQYCLYKVAALEQHLDSPDWRWLVAAAAAQDIAAQYFA